MTGKRTIRLRCRNIAQRTCAASSFSEKYQWPDAGFDRFETSPDSHTYPSPCSSSERASRFRRVIVKISRGGGGLAPESAGRSNMVGRS